MTVVRGTAPPKVFELLKTVAAKHPGVAKEPEPQIYVLLPLIDTSLPFPELRRLSYIDYRARDADGDPAFSSLIRKGL